MGEVYVGLHVIEEIKKENQGDERVRGLMIDDGTLVILRT